MGIPHPEALGCAAFVSSANKCIEGVPGFGFVIARKDEIAALTRWVEIGAPWPGSGKDATVARREKHGLEVTEQHRAWWSFRPVKRPEVPAVNELGRHWMRNPIDAFIYARLAADQLSPAPVATRRELIRR